MAKYLNISKYTKDKYLNKSLLYKKYIYIFLNRLID